MAAEAAAADARRAAADAARIEQVITAALTAVQAAADQVTAAARAATGQAAPAPQPPASDQGTAEDPEHKRDEDRAATQQTLGNTRWDTQHTLDNTRWDTRHTLENTRWDTQHTLDNTRWDTRHTLDNTRWDTQHTLDNTRWDTYLALKRSREDTALAVDSTLLEAVHAGYIAVAQSSLDRAVQRATYVSTAAGAVASIYTAVLALRFSSSNPLSARSLIPALFIGGAVAASTWYMAFLRGKTMWTQLLPSGLGGSIAETRLLDFMEWVFAGVLARAWSLRLSVISLALGLAFLPIGFVRLSTTVTWILGGGGAGLLLLWILGEFYIARYGPPFTKSRRKRGQRARRQDAEHRETEEQDAGHQDAGHQDAPAAERANARGVRRRGRASKWRPSRFASRPERLPAKPAAATPPTDLKSFGLPDRPQPARRSGGPNPPTPPEVARDDPPKPPERADGPNPPTPPEVAKGDPPKAPDPVARGPQSTTPTASPAPIKVEVEVEVDQDKGP